MIKAPNFLQDARRLLTKQGFASSDVWYHGTSSALIDSINAQGLLRSGDKALQEAIKKTMATIGNSYAESIEPVFLTQSKELAFYWAEQSIKSRNARFAADEQAVVFKMALSERLNAQVKPDVGAASLLLTKEGENYMAYLGEIYESNGFGVPDIDLRQAERMEYLDTLGMAYINADIDAVYLSIISN